MNSCYKCEYEDVGYCKRYPPKEHNGMLNYKFMPLKDYSGGCGEWKPKSYKKKEEFNGALTNGFK